MVFLLLLLKRRVLMKRSKVLHLVQNIFLRLRNRRFREKAAEFTSNPYSERDALPVRGNGGGFEADADEKDEAQNDDESAKIGSLLSPRRRMMKERRPPES